ncbi:protein FAR-RED-ELONGATED HYPOCOTYL 1-LIKE-like [Andrographis paniculata]|uniref:protein FAR-RED-ELONGATED HYPOCOTYL 1-LIKE-like n=1 Tax=Andrographis paniculata TaxID=175694 RepID=UPI0021E997C0|nr:protein FAR-RED-ELONGATED HYPOCOTYL 1-LIKE-like [Andrographis paniculata]
MEEEEEEEFETNSSQIKRFIDCCSCLDVHTAMDTNVAYLYKKRKLRSEFLETNFPRHVCGDQMLESDASELSTKKVKSSLYDKGVKSNSDSADSCITCPPDGPNSCILYLKMPTPSTIKPFTTSAGCDGSSSVIIPDPLENQLLEKSSSGKLESSSICEEAECHGLQQTDGYEELVEFGGYANCNCLECLKGGIEYCTDEELQNPQLAHHDYVLSSGRWSVCQDTQQDTRKLTIDKEFEEYFSMLML